MRINKVTPTMKNILIVATGTGGHVMPALQVLEMLKPQVNQIIWLGSKQGIENKLLHGAARLEKLDVFGFKGKNVLQKLKALFKVIPAIFKTCKIIKLHNINTVIVWGGFISVPAGIAAKLSGCKLILHEQNVILGLSNRILVGIADKLLCGLNYAKLPGNKVLNEKIIKKMDLVGVPTKVDSYDLTKKPISEKLRILVLGGSLGANFLNDIVPESLATLKDYQRPEVLHQTGAGKFCATEENYKKHNVHAVIKEFIGDMSDAYHWADLVICRAGAATLTELSKTASAAILVPFPYAADNHQFHNAKLFSSHKAAVLFEQHELHANRLREVILEYVEYPELLVELRKNIAKLYVSDSDNKIVSSCLAN